MLSDKLRTVAPVMLLFPFAQNFQLLTTVRNSFETFVKTQTPSQ